MEEVLRDVHTGKTTMNDSCNVGKVSTSTKGWYKEVEVWPNKGGIGNLLLIPMLEAANHLVSTHTYGNWVVTSPKKRKDKFQTRHRSVQQDAID
jgi:hypothetical protein